jgi:hypothetical protein
MRKHIAGIPPELIANQRSLISALKDVVCRELRELLQFPQRLPSNPSNRQGLEIHGDGPDDRVVEAQPTGGERGGLVAGPQVANLRALA